MTKQTNPLKYGKGLWDYSAALTEPQTSPLERNLVTSWLCFPNSVPPSSAINCSAISYISSANLT